MIDGQNVFYQPIQNYLRTYDNVRKIAIGQGDDFTTGFSLDYPYFKESYKLIAIDLSKRQPLDANPKAMQQINSTGNPDRQGTIFLIFQKKIFFFFNSFRFFTINCKYILILFLL